MRVEVYLLPSVLVTVALAVLVVLQVEEYDLVW